MFPPAVISRSYLRWFNTSAEIVIWQKGTVIETKQSHWAEQTLCHTRMFHFSSALCWRQCHCLWQSWRGFISLIKIILINQAQDSLVLKKHWLIIELDWLWRDYTALFPFRQSSSWLTNIILIKQITPLKDKLSSATNSDTIPDTALECDPTFRCSKISTQICGFALSVLWGKRVLKYMQNDKQQKNAIHKS